MRFETDGDTVGVETDPEDTELARAVADTARSAVDLVTALSGDGDDAPTDGECYECGEAGDLRPFPAASEDGEPISIDVCASCQPDLVERQLAANVDAEPVGNTDGIECPNCGEPMEQITATGGETIRLDCKNCSNHIYPEELDAFEGDA